MTDYITSTISVFPLKLFQVIKCSLEFSLCYLCIIYPEDQSIRMIARSGDMRTMNLNHTYSEVGDFVLMNYHVSTNLICT